MCSFRSIPGIQQHDSGTVSLWNLFLVAHQLFISDGIHIAKGDRDILPG